MEKMKYINSEYRVIIGRDKVYNGVNDAYSWIEVVLPVIKRKDNENN